MTLVVRMTFFSSLSSSLPPEHASSCEGLLSVEGCVVALRGWLAARHLV